MFKIFPITIHDGRKIPLIKGWQEAATNEPEAIELWKNLFRDKLKYWGIPCGPANDLFVLDADVKTGGLETIKTLVLPSTTTQRTMSGGLHFLFRYPRDGKHYGNRVGFMPGLDTRGAGGFIVYYGTDQTPIADAPQWLLDAVVSAPVEVQGATVKVAPEIAQAIIEKSLEAIREAPEGESNNVLNTEAFKIGQLVASESITMEYAEAALFRAAKERGKPDYEAKASLRREGAAKPELDKIVGLRVGADDYMTKPFSLAELTARVYAVIGAVARGADPEPSRGELLDYLTREVVPHLRTEERMVYNLARGAGERGLVAAMEVDHRALLRQVESIKKAATPLEAAMAARAFLVLFALRMEKEEKVLLPVLAAQGLDVRELIEGRPEIVGTPSPG